MSNAFPIRPEPADDGRFTFGLVFEIQDVLIKHGYPSDWSGADLVELQQALYRFLYSERQLWRKEIGA